MSMRQAHQLLPAISSAGSARERVHLLMQSDFLGSPEAGSRGGVAEGQLDENYTKASE